VLREREATGIPKPRKAQPADNRSSRVIGGKPRKAGKNKNVVGIAIAICVIVLLAGAAAAYFLMM